MSESRRGGSYHLAGPAVDRSDYHRVFSAHPELVMDLGAYERIGRADAAHGKGLVQLQSIIVGLLKVNNSGRLNAPALKNAILDLVVENPSLNKTCYNNSVFAGLKAERFVTVFYHLRRIKRESVRRRQCLANLDSEGSQALIDMFATDGREVILNPERQNATDRQSTWDTIGI